MAEKSTLLCKVCGMTDTDNILAVSALQPDLMGFIFYRESKRYVGETFTVPRDLPATIGKVGVFVNQHVEDILSLVRRHGLQYVQLHGDELPGQCAFLKEHGCRVIKAFGVGDGFSFTATQPYKDHVDWFLFDTKTSGYGGSGRKFDWSLLKDYDQEVPFLISGGVGPRELEDFHVLHGMNLVGIDMNSGVESSPGIKDIAKVNSVLNKIRSL